MWNKNNKYKTKKKTKIKKKIKKKTTNKIGSNLSYDFMLSSSFLISEIGFIRLRNAFILKSY